MTNASKNRSVVSAVDRGFELAADEPAAGLVVGAAGFAAGRLSGGGKSGGRRGGGAGGRAAGRVKTAGVDKLGTGAGAEVLSGGDGVVGRSAGTTLGTTLGAAVAVEGGGGEGRRNSEGKRAGALEVERRRLLVEERKRRAELDRVRAMKPPRLWGMQASIRKMRAVMGQAVTLDGVLGVWRSPEALEAMPRVQRVKLAQAAKLARRLKAGLMQSVCSSSWMETCMHGVGVPAYPPVADSLNCRMVRARDMDHLADRLLPGQSRRRMVPAIYTTARGYSFDAVFEAQELNRRRLAKQLAMPVMRRCAGYFQFVKGGYAAVEEEEE